MAPAPDKRDPAVAPTPRSWRDGVTRYQWLVLFVAWLGWVFDSMDATIYAIVLHPALDELLRGSLGTEVGQAQIGWYGGLIFSIFLVGWAIGGVAFGLLADAIGRTKTLIISILIYALFTGLAALSQDWWHLALYRFVTALGIGGEWAAGASLVAETWPEDKRARAAGILQSAWAAGFFLAAAFNLIIGGYGWRALFLVGVLPALVAFVVRLFVREPERWLNARAAHPATGPAWSPLADLFKSSLRRPTLIGSTLAFVAVFGLWGATNWTPTLIAALPEMADLDQASLSRYVSYAVMALNVGALAGYMAFGPLADRIGRRGTFAIMCAGSLVMLPVTYLTPHAYAQVLVFLPLLGFFNNGIFSGFPIYLPELYPTRLRATGAGFCFNIGRVLASVGPFVTGALVVALGSFGRAASAIAVIYLLGLAVLPFAPETKGRPLPD